MLNDNVFVSLRKYRDHNKTLSEEEEKMLVTAFIFALNV